MDTWDMIPFLRRRWLTIGATAAVVVLVTMAVTLALPPVYQSTAALSIQPLTRESAGMLPSAAQQGATTVGELIKGPGVAQRAAKTLGASPDSLGVTLEYRVIENSNLVEIVAEAGTPLRAAQAANAVAQAYIEENAAVLRASFSETERRLDQKLVELRTKTAILQRELAVARARHAGAAQIAALQDRMASTQTSYEQVLRDWQGLPSNQVALASGVQIASRAMPSDSPVRPRPTTNLVLSLVAGLFLGFAVARVCDGTRLSGQSSVEPGCETDTRYQDATGDSE